MVKQIIGILLVITGIIGTLLPVIPGIALIIAGFILIGNKKLLVLVRHTITKISSFFKRRKR